MIMMYTIILSFQIWFPFLDSRSLDNSKSLFGKRFDLLSWSLPLTKVLEDWDVASSEPKTKRYDRNRQMLLLLFKNFLTGPGSSLLPSYRVRPLPSPWLPPPAWCCTTSAPPWTTSVLVLTTLAWCHSLFELRSSPLWLVIKVPSSISLVNGFL